MATKMDSVNQPPTSSSLCPHLAIPVRRRVLFSAIAATCQEVGFHSADNFMLDMLVQMFQAFLAELSCNAKNICEHSGRSEPLPADILMALFEMGFNISSLPAYARRTNRIFTPNPSMMNKLPTPRILQTGRKKQLLSYIPEYMPPFPDSHSYIATPTYKQPITDYETIREKSSGQKRDVERAVTRFTARTFHSSLAYSLFPDEQLSHLFPLVGIKPDNVPYLSALLPKDRMLNSQSNQFEAILKHTGQFQTDESKSSNDQTVMVVDTTKDATVAEVATGEDCSLNETIENPFLLPPKMNNFF